jgi:hypothetical protein
VQTCPSRSAPSEYPWPAKRHALSADVPCGANMSGHNVMKSRSQGRQTDCGGLLSGPVALASCFSLVPKFFCSFNATQKPARPFQAEGIDDPTEGSILEGAKSRRGPRSPAGGISDGSQVMGVGLSSFKQLQQASR